MLLWMTGYSIGGALKFGASHRVEYRARIEAGIRAAVHEATTCHKAFRSVGHMRVMAFASQKEGPGMTALAGHIAPLAGLAEAGPIAIIDTDSQGSLPDWQTVRRAQTPVFAQTFMSRLAEAKEST